MKEKFKSMDFWIFLAMAIVVMFNYIPKPLLILVVFAGIIALYFKLKTKETTKWSYQSDE